MHRSRLGGLLVLFIAANAHAFAPPPSTRELADMSLEDLANLEITSVSKRPERLADAPASVFVITRDDIRRSGATTLPEALRLAPNLQVAQATATGYNILARGFNGAVANKLLVLIDGRSVYSPLYSGVFWDVQDVLLEDVERIEVLSGPGGTLWGVNAVNGVINVITRPSADTQSEFLAAAAGNRESSAAGHVGGTIGTNGRYRVYAKYRDVDASRTAAGVRMDDGAHLASAGLRTDWELARGHVMAVAGVYSGAMGQPLPGTISIGGVNLALAPIPVRGMNLTTRWAQRLEGGSDLLLQAYYDRTERTVPPTFADKLDTFDVQMQQSLAYGGGHQFVWGAQYRYGVDHTTSSSDFFAFLPADLDQKWASLFAQNETQLRKDLRLTAGVRLERNDYTGTEFLPQLRLAWKVSDSQLVWGALSRTVRAPSRLDHDAYVPARPPFLLDGGRTVVSEVARVAEIGFRGQLGAATSFAVTVFHSEYDHLRTQEIAPSRTFLVYANGMEGDSDGIEMWASHQLTRAWRISVGYAAQRERLRLKPGSNDASAPASAGRDPASSWTVRSSATVFRDVEIDVIGRGVAPLANPDVPGYIAADLRLAWHPRPELELALTGRNLADAGHGEFTSVLTRAEIGRSFLISARWTFDAL